MNIFTRSGYTPRAKRGKVMHSKLISVIIPVYNTSEYLPRCLDSVRNSPCFCHAPCMIRREAFLKVGGYTERDRYLRCEDVNLWYKLYAAGYVGYNIQEPLYAMRDDLNAYKRRTLKNRMNIILTEWDGMRSLDCQLSESHYFLKKAAKHIILAFLPRKIYQFLHQKRLNS